MFDELLAGAAEDDSFHAEEFVLAFELVLAAVDWFDDEEDWSTTMGAVLAEVVVESVVAVWEDLVLLLQPLRANPAKIKVNNIEFFIGGLSCEPTDRGMLVRFATHLARRRSRRRQIDS